MTYLAIKETWITLPFVSQRPVLLRREPDIIQLKNLNYIIYWCKINIWGLFQQIQLRQAIKGVKMLAANISKIRIFTASNAEQLMPI